MNNNYNYNLKPEPTIQAIRLADELKQIGVKCELEKSDGYKHIDIAITSAFLNIEIDGCHHNLDKEQAKRDLNRTYYSYIKGYNTIRIPNSLLKEEKDIKYTAQRIKEMIEQKPKSYNQRAIQTIKEKEKIKYLTRIGIGIGIVVIIAILIL
ncbi:DUF559 domain-containing protein [Dysgonomonas sp. HGC4]|uniref:DUF559 domain-containing protein n=1 Tax=Dysgonomonas sp. HGC4 TaxID=1658009 RepID=UPI00068021EA|nr:DUF559 domain-containing protein [Dysgonomonas sp. HGC4]MBD8347741.1 DUF559 domain-containing protein [Dysgonomonas sp. HGC4]